MRLAGHESKGDRTMTNNMQVANTILDQLGGGRFAAMTGAKCFAAIESGVRFKLPAKAGWIRDGINMVTVRLTPSDTYTVEYGRLWGTKYTVIATSENVYCDTLQADFCDATGVFTSL
jgi:hypothetical protein